MDGLPPGWVVRTSKSFKKEYYFNTRTGESRWEPPGTGSEGAPQKAKEGTAPPAASASGKSGEETSHTGDNASRKRARAAEAPAVPAAASAPAPKRKQPAPQPKSGIDSLLSSDFAPPAVGMEQFKTRAERARERFFQQKTKFRAETEAKIRSFIADDEATTLPFPPAEKEDRTVIHEIAALYSLVSESVGENYDRHPVVYKPGSEPEHLRPEAVEAAQEAQRARVEAQAKAARDAQRQAQIEREKERQRRQMQGGAPAQVFVRAVAKREREISMEEALLRAGWKTDEDGDAGGAGAGAGAAASAAAGGAAAAPRHE